VVVAQVPSEEAACAWEVVNLAVEEASFVLAAGVGRVEVH